MDIKKELFIFTCMYEKLKAEKQPVLLYGMGDGAEKIYNELNKRGIEIQGIFASEGFVRGQSFLGNKVMSLSEAEERYGCFTAVLCFALEGKKADILTHIKEKHALYSPNIPVYGGGVCDKEYIFANIDKIQKLYECLADEKSKEILLSVLKYNITGQIEYLSCGEDTFSYPEGFFVHNKRHIDVGAFDGDTALEYEDYNKNYSDIVAFEPDKTNYKKLADNTFGIRSIICENAAVSDRDGLINVEGKGNRGSFISEDTEGNIKTVSIDAYCHQRNINENGIEVGSIKIDAEGMDRQVLQGAVNVIYRNRPDIMAAVYHRAGDLFDIPLLLRSYDYKYKLYLRKKDYVPAWDIFVLAAR